MTPAKDQAPGFIIGNVSVKWRIKTDAFLCKHKDFDYCDIEKKACCWVICPLKIKNTFKETKEETKENKESWPTAVDKNKFMGVY